MMRTMVMMMMLVLFDRRGEVCIAIEEAFQTQRPLLLLLALILFNVLLIIRLNFDLFDLLCLLSRNRRLCSPAIYWQWIHQIWNQWIHARVRCPGLLLSGLSSVSPLCSTALHLYKWWTVETVWRVRFSHLYRCVIFVFISSLSQLSFVFSRCLWPLSSIFIRCLFSIFAVFCLYSLSFSLYSL